MRWNKILLLCFKLLDLSSSSTSRVNSTCATNQKHDLGPAAFFCSTLRQSFLQRSAALPHASTGGTGKYLSTVVYITLLEQQKDSLHFLTQRNPPGPPERLSRHSPTPAREPGEPGVTWMGNTAASRTTKGFTLKALLSAAAWYTAPMAAASSALMFLPNSSLRSEKQQASAWQPLPRTAAC